eukprot:14410517-Alexandrium_andersonii.AAC.1
MSQLSARVDLADLGPWQHGTHTCQIHFGKLTQATHKRLALPSNWGKWRNCLLSPCDTPISARSNSLQAPP